MSDGGSGSLYFDVRSHSHFEPVRVRVLIDRNDGKGEQLLWRFVFGIQDVSFSTVFPCDELCHDGLSAAIVVEHDCKGVSARCSWRNGGVVRRIVPRMRYVPKSYVETPLKDSAAERLANLESRMDALESRVDLRGPMTRERIEFGKHAVDRWFNPPVEQETKSA